MFISVDIVVFITNLVFDAHKIIGTCFTAQDIPTNIKSIFQLPNKRFKITKALPNKLY